jgi:hypothetical protein
MAWFWPIYKIRALAIHTYQQAIVIHQLNHLYCTSECLSIIDDYNGKGQVASSIYPTQTLAAEGCNCGCSLLLARFLLVEPTTSYSRLNLLLIYNLFL